MSYLVARMKKLKSGNLTGISRHNERLNERNSNKDIDSEKSHLNYNLVQNNSEDLLKDTQNFIDENKSTSRAIRKDSVMINEWIISSDTEFFENLSEDESREYFKTAVEYFETRFGVENVRYAHVHLDETTPHMHLGIVPFDKENKLSAKRVFNRTTLLEVQENLPKFLNNRGFDIERGEQGSDKKHLDVKSFKKEMDRKLKAQELMLEEKEKMIAELTKQATGLEIEVAAMKMVSEELSDELEEKTAKLESIEFSAKDYGYNNIEEVLYENHYLNKQVEAIFEKLKNYAKTLSNLKINVLTIADVKTNISSLIDALKEFKSKLEVDVLSFESYKKEIKPARTEESLLEKMDRAKEQLNHERQRKAPKQDLGEPER